MKKLSKSIDFISTKFGEYGRERQEKDKLISDMKTDKLVMNKKIENFEEIVDRQKLYSRRNWLLLHGIAENEGENIDDLVLKNLHKIK